MLSVNVQAWQSALITLKRRPRQGVFVTDLTAAGASADLAKLPAMAATAWRRPNRNHRKAPVDGRVHVVILINASLHHD
jgi:hypothetical protein